MTDKEMTDAELVEAARQTWPNSTFIENTSIDLLNGVYRKTARAVLEAALSAERGKKC